MDTPKGYKWYSDRSRLQSAVQCDDCKTVKRPKAGNTTILLAGWLRYMGAPEHGNVPVARWCPKCAPKEIRRVGKKTDTALLEARNEIKQRAISDAAAMKRVKIFDYWTDAGLTVEQARNLADNWTNQGEYMRLKRQYNVANLMPARSR